MSNRHDRRRAAAASRKNLAKLKTGTLDQHLDDMMGRVRAEFERTGEICTRFECVTDGESFEVPVSWPDRRAKAAACAALRDSFRRRGVNRYVFASEFWTDNTPGLRFTDDPNRGEVVQVIAVERNGTRRGVFAEITRNGERATLGPWEVICAEESWLLELLEEGHSDQAPKTEPPPVARLSALEFQSLMYEDPEQAADFRDSVEITDQLGDLIWDQVQKDANANPHTILLALECVLRSIVTDMGSPKGIGSYARFLRDHPDHFPMFATVHIRAPSTENARRCKATLRRFICEKRELGKTDFAILEAFMHMYMYVGSQVIGALNLARRIDVWCPEYQAKLRQVGLRSSRDLDDEEGRVFFALSADQYPISVMGRRNDAGELFVTEALALKACDFATAVNEVKQNGLDVILGPAAEELFLKMQQVEEFPPRTKP